MQNIMTTNKNQAKLIFSSLLFVSWMMISCNKELEVVPDTPVTPATGQTLDKVMSANADDSLYFNLLKRGGLLSMLQDSSKSYTLFATNNAGIKPVLSALAAQFSITFNSCSSL